MTLSQNLTQFKFNLETIDLLKDLGRSHRQTIDEMMPLGFTADQVNFILSSRPILSSVLLRLVLYSEQKLSDEKIRTNLGVLNNPAINNLLDKMLLTCTSTTVTTVTPVVESTTVKMEEDDEDEGEEEVETLPSFETFFTTCVKTTNDPTDIVKTGEFYTAFTEWWTKLSTTPVPDKNELKDFLTEKLGKSNKNTWSNVRL